jgi:hypothetical protein
MAAALGSLMMCMMFKPAMAPASMVARRWELLR